MSIRQLVPADALALVALRRVALTREPLVFASSPQDDRVLSVEFAHEILADVQNQAVFGYFACDLQGMIGLMRNPKAKQRHKAGLWGMYVTPDARRRGAARSMLLAAIEHARSWKIEQVHLGVTDAAVKTLRDCRLPLLGQ